jgi:hypothetical protein
MIPYVEEAIVDDAITPIRGRTYACGVDAEAEDTCDRCPDPDQCIDRSYDSIRPVREPAERSLTPDVAATAATLVDLMKRNLPPHISEAQQVEAYLALKRIAGDQRS